MLLETVWGGTVWAIIGGGTATWVAAAMMAPLAPESLEDIRARLEDIRARAPAAEVPEAPAEEQKEAEQSGGIPRFYPVDFLKSFKDQEHCQRLPDNHNIPLYLLKDHSAAATEIGEFHRAGGSRKGSFRPGGSAGGRPAAGSFGSFQRRVGFRNVRDSTAADGDSRRDDRDRDRDDADKWSRDKWRCGREDDSGWRGGRDRDRDDNKVVVGENSWVASMKKTKVEQNESEAVLRKLKGILNKLTIEKFDRLYQQILDAGITQNSEIEALVGMVFDKATTQHHFIQMYVELCVLLKDNLKAIMERGDKADGHQEGTEEDKEFRRMLLNRCQESFEKYLKPPDNLNGLTGNDYTEAYLKYKNQMLGNIKFVGQLLIERIMSANLLFECLKQLWHYGEKQGKEGEAQFECVCTFLTTIGPVYDVAKDWNRRAELQQWFHKLEEKSRDENLGIRVRCLMKDVLDLRANGWRRMVKPGMVGGPSKLRDIHRQHVEEKGEDIVLSRTNLELRGLASPSEGLLPIPSAGPKPPAVAAAASASSSRLQEASRVPSRTPGKPTSVITSRRVLKGSDLRGDRHEERRERRQRREREKEERATGNATTPTAPPTQPTAADERSTSPAAAAAAPAAGGGANQGTSPQPASAAFADEGREELIHRMRSKAKDYIKEYTFSSDLEDVTKNFADMAIPADIHRYLRPYHTHTHTHTHSRIHNTCFRVVSDLMSWIAEQNESQRAVCYPLLILLAKPSTDGSPAPLTPDAIQDGVREFAEYLDDLMLDLPKLKDIIAQDFIPTCASEDAECCVVPEDLIADLKQRCGAAGTSPYRRVVSAGDGEGRKAWADVSGNEDVLPHHHQHRGERGTPQRRDEEEEKDELYSERERGDGGGGGCQRDRPSRPPGRDGYDEYDDKRGGGGVGGYRDRGYDADSMGGRRPHPTRGGDGGHDRFSNLGRSDRARNSGYRGRDRRPSYRFGDRNRDRDRGDMTPASSVSPKSSAHGEDKPFHPVQHLHLDKPKGQIDTPASLPRQGRTASIFGTGKPRDEKEILQRKQEERAKDDPLTPASASGSASASASASAAHTHGQTSQGKPKHTHTHTHTHKEGDDDHHDHPPGQPTPPAASATAVSKPSGGGGNRWNRWKDREHQHQQHHGKTLPPGSLITPQGVVPRSHPPPPVDGSDTAGRSGLHLSPTDHGKIAETPQAEASPVTPPQLSSGGPRPSYAAVVKGESATSPSPAPPAAPIHYNTTTTTSSTTRGRGQASGAFNTSHQSSQRTPIGRGGRGGRGRGDLGYRPKQGSPSPTSSPVTADSPEPQVDGHGGREENSPAAGGAGGEGGGSGGGKEGIVRRHDELSSQNTLPTVGSISIDGKGNEHVTTASRQQADRKEGAPGKKGSKGSSGVSANNPFAALQNDDDDDD
ncbi:unnamed protein product [Vitrella brassicaformis CCMP3155]|uniref:MIF4G domain-containing protein n=1 Tax=Vitrella brassicaformis (strain CCMP3155) TaxID=1169540 RepID=A0A0G4EMI7_VITBC|nr:unnamed protein product [Vitrella brassicaformis CCMP3155]|eukprot:CEL98189.1 unnamed protein product [Vitrella brassicaformis CCMP3155]